MPFSKLFLIMKFHFALLLILCLLSGCGKIKTVEISGKITLDGEPIEIGMIQFVPTAQSGGREGGGRIREGKYTATVSLGENIVKVLGSEGTGEMYRPDPELYPDDYTERFVEVTDEAFHWGKGTLMTVTKGGELDIDLPPSPNKSKRK